MMVHVHSPDAAWFFIVVMVGLILVVRHDIKKEAKGGLSKRG